MERILAKGNAVAVSDSLTLSADTLDIRTTGTLIDRVLAWGPGRARATSPDRDVVASRIEILMPGQRMRDLIATGNARADTKPDSTIRSTEHDWILGDTLVATFDQTAGATKPNAQPPLRVLTARGNAKSLYQVAPRNKTDTVPSINYVAGRRIQIQFVKGATQDVRVDGQVTGVNLTPTATADTTAGRGGRGRTPPKGRGG
jgi:hypothetical protein